MPEGGGPDAGACGKGATARAADGRTPVSVFNLAGLGGLEGQQSFVNQLTMTLFTWVKKHPQPGQTGLGGLLLIDEAKDFVPSSTLVGEDPRRMVPPKSFTPSSSRSL